MPCDTIRTVTVNLEVADLALLKGALDRLQFGPIVLGDNSIAIQTPLGGAILRQGQITAPVGYSGVRSEAALVEIAGQIKRAYATEAVTTAAKRYGFALSTDKQDATHLRLQRRAF